MDPQNLILKLTASDESFSRLLKGSTFTINLTVGVDALEVARSVFEEDT